jgi:hypothetical protein
LHQLHQPFNSGCQNNKHKQKQVDGQQGNEHPVNSANDVASGFNINLQRRVEFVGHSSNNTSIFAVSFLLFLDHTCAGGWCVRGLQEILLLLLLLQSFHHCCHIVQQFFVLLTHKLHFLLQIFILLNDCNILLPQFL